MCMMVTGIDLSILGSQELGHIVNNKGSHGKSIRMINPLEFLSRKLTILCVCVCVYVHVYAIRGDPGSAGCS